MAKDGAAAGYSLFGGPRAGLGHSGAGLLSPRAPHRLLQAQKTQSK